MDHPRHILEVKRDGKTVTVCDNPIRHTPRPQRIIGHHILPQVCGGATIQSNIAAICDNCHYAIHTGMWVLQNDPHMFGHLRLSKFADEMALRGYKEAVALGTQNMIPKEGTPE